MRIISNFHDYYDTAMGYGIDLELIYLRKEKVVKEGAFGAGKWYRWQGRGVGPSYTGMTCKSYAIGFCGKVYGCLELSWEHPSKPNKSALCYDVESADKFVEDNFKKKQLEWYHDKKSHRYGWDYPFYIGITRKAILEYFKKSEENRDSYAKFFLKHHVPIFVSNQHGKTVLNSSLRKLEFFRVFDPYTAFQELQMYWSSGACPPKPIPHISDEDMLEIKGFDPKWSFRKEPGEKKRKGKRKKKGNG